MQQQQRQMPTSQLLKRFIPYFYKYRKLLVIDLMAAGLTTVLVGSAEVPGRIAGAIRGGFEKAWVFEAE